MAPLHLARADYDEHGGHQEISTPGCWLEQGIPLTAGGCGLMASPLSGGPYLEGIVVNPLIFQTGRSACQPILLIQSSAPLAPAPARSSLPCKRVRSDAR